MKNSLFPNTKPFDYCEFRSKVLLFFPGKSEHMLAALTALGIQEKITIIFTAQGFKELGGAGELSPSA